METVFSGYCRRIDGARIVLAETDGADTEPDCEHASCAYRSECPLFRKITEQAEPNGCKKE